MIELDIHADDYGLTLHTSRDILECMKKGKLDSISVLTNMSCSGKCMELLAETIPELPFLPAMSRFLNTSARTCSGVPKGMVVWVPIVPWKESLSPYFP